MLASSRRRRTSRPGDLRRVPPFQPFFFLLPFPPAGRYIVGQPPATRRGAAVKVLCCHPSGLMYNKCFLRLEPLGVELVAAAARRAGHAVRLLDLQTHTHADFFRTLDDFQPDALGFGLNYLANIPEVLDLCKA